MDWHTDSDASSRKKLEESNERLAKEKKQLEFKLETLLQALEKQKSKTEEWQARCNQLEYEMNKLSGENEQFHNKNKKLECDINTKVNRIICLESALDTSRSKHVDFEAQINGLNSQIEKLESEKNEFIKRIDKLTVEVNEKRETIEKQHKELDAIENEIKWVEERSSAVAASPRAAGDVNGNATPKKFDSVSSPYRTPRKTPLNRIENEVDRLKNQIDVLVADNESQQLEIRSLKSQMECERKNEILVKEAMQKRFLEKEISLKDQINELTHIINRYETEFNAKNSRKIEPVTHKNKLFTDELDHNSNLSFSREIDDFLNQVVEETKIDKILICEDQNQDAFVKVNVEARFSYPNF